MNQRGEYGHDPHRLCAARDWMTAVGAAPWQAGDADRAVNQLDAEMEAIIDATYRSMGVDPAALRRPPEADAAWMQRVRAAKSKAMQSPLWSYWETTVSPKYDDWKRARETFRTKPMTSWDDYVLWLPRVRHLHADVKVKGIKLDTPELVDLSKDIAGKGGEASSIDRSKLLKWGAIGALAIGGVAALAALASSTKSAREPYERYRYGYFAR